MAKDDLKTLRCGAPWTGLNESADPRLLELGESPDVSNMVVRDGRWCPRPGYEEVIADSLGLALKRIYYSNSNVIGQIAYEPIAGLLYWTEPAAGTLNRMVLATGAVSSLGSLSTPRGVAIQGGGTTVYFTQAGSGKVCSRPHDFSGSTTELVTSESTPCALAIDISQSLLFWVLSGGAIRSSTTGGSSVGNFISAANAGTLGTLSDLEHNDALGKIFWTTTDRICKSADDSAANTNVATLVTGTSGSVGAGVSTNGNVLYFNPTATSIAQYNASTGALTATLMQSEASVTQINFIQYINVTGTSDRVVFADSPGTGGGIAQVYNNTAVAASYPISTEWFRRSILAVDQSTYHSKDIVWSQIVNTANSNSEMAILFPALGIQKSIQMGYHPYTGTADGSPTIWATDDRDSDPTYFDPFSTSSARVDFAWTGRGIDTAKGGWLVAQKGAGARVLNYVLSDTIWTYTETDDGGPSTGLYRFNFDGYSSTQDVPIPATVAQVRENILELPGINGIDVTKSGSTFTIRIHGVWSGQNTPALTITKNGGSGSLSQPSRAQTGGLDTGASGYVGSMVYCRPAGLPRPTLDPLFSDGWYGDQQSGTAVSNGYYNYRITYYSSRWDIESPPTDIMGDTPASSNYIVLDGSNIALIRLPTGDLPTTLYFNATPFRHIDTVRLYRRKWGTSSATDGVGADDDWYLVQVYDIGSTAVTGAISISDDGDPADKTTVKLPVVNEYPPTNAALVELHDDRAVYNSGDNLIWISELPKRGGVVDGELGFEYVSNELFNQINRQVKNDFPVTALKSHAGRLFVGTPERMLAIDTSLLTTQGTIFVDPMEGTSGVVNSGCVCETSPLPDMPGYLLWLSPYGHVYAFNGATSQRLSLNLVTSVDDMVKKFWIDDTYFESGLKTLHYASMVVDPVEQRIILSTWDKSGTAYNLCYSVADKAWSKWTLGGFGLENGRLWTGTDKGKDIVVVGLAGGKLWKLMDGYADAVTSTDMDGSSFAWYVKTKKLGPTSGFYKTKWGKLAAMFNARDFSATPASFTLTPVIGKGNLTAANVTSTQKDLAAVSTTGSRSHWVQLNISGTHTHLMDHAEISAVVAEYDPTVTGDLGDTDNDPTS